MKSGWFGESWGAPCCEPEDHVPTPVGTPCVWCEEVIGQDDQGVTDMAGQPMHLSCQIRSISGGVNHMLGKCTCCGGTEPPDPPNMTRREAAIAADTLWHQILRRGSRP